MEWMGSPLKMLGTLMKNIPNFSTPNPNSSLKNPKKLGLSNAEMEKGMDRINVYSISDHTEEYRWTVGYVEGKTHVEFLFFNKSDADEACKNLVPHKPNIHHLHGIDLPLNEIVDWQGTGEPIRLVPELSQVKNARQLTGRDVAGVPVFQTDLLKIKYVSDPCKYHLPTFFRKEDLEESLVLLEDQRPPSVDIQVSSFEEIIKSMKDCSTSTRNDVVFIGPGQTLMSWGTLVD